MFLLSVVALVLGTVAKFSLVRVVYGFLTPFFFNPF